MSSSVEDLQNFLCSNPSVEFVRFQWVDYSGVLRARFVPTSRCLQIASGHPAMCLAQNSMIIPISTAPVIFSLSDYHETWNLLPDWSSLRVCGTNANHATAMCFVDQKDALHEFDKCPRTSLIRALQRLEEGGNTEVLIGFEIEIVLLDGHNKVTEPMDRLNGYSRIAGLRAGTLDLVEDIVSALREASIGVHHFHAEVRDQLEIALAAEPALKAVDSLVLAQEIIRTICVRRGLKATMAPKPTLAGPTNGLHLHLSLANVDRASADHFLAGVLGHMGALCAFGMASYDSYARAVGDAAGAWIGFGTDNRDLPARKIDDAHWEFRMMDGTANPYLFVAAVLFAGAGGVENGTELAWRDCKFFPNLLDEERRAEFGMDKRMPATLSEALEWLKKSADVKTWFGEDLLKWYISVKEKEVEGFAKMGNEQRRIRFLEYF